MIKSTLDNEMHDFVVLAQMYLEKILKLLNCHNSQTNAGELASFIAYALAFPSDFLVLVDTYNVLK